jgi:hypothetical protein
MVHSTEKGVALILSLRNCKQKKLSPKRNPIKALFFFCFFIVMDFRLRIDITLDNNKNRSFVTEVIF